MKNPVSGRPRHVNEDAAREHPDPALKDRRPPRPLGLQGRIKKLALSPTPIPSKVTESGISPVSQSVTLAAKRSEQKIPAIQKAGVFPSALHRRNQKRPEASSTTGYRQAILSRQRRQRPPRTRKLKTGILSNQAMAFPHAGQWEGGVTTEIPFGSLEIHTFKKLPMERPARRTKISSIKLVVTLFPENGPHHGDGRPPPGPETEGLRSLIKKHPEPI